MAQKRIPTAATKPLADAAPGAKPGWDASGRIFLLSPAKITGLRAKLLLNPQAEFELARRLRTEGASLGEVFSFMSGLYFRGKLVYARMFAAPPFGMSGSLVITSGGGLIAPDTIITRERLREISAAEVDVKDANYCEPLVRDSRILAEAAGQECQIVLLGSIATSKYVRPLLEVFGERLCFPTEFLGRGDLSRGGLMLRCVRAGVQLTYVPVAGAPRHGPKPPKLEPGVR